MFGKKRVYLDHAAATLLSKAAYRAMKPLLRGTFANPSAVHREGVAAKRCLEEARTAVARTLEVKPEAVTFTAGGTEANNLAILGTVNALYRDGFSYTDMEVVTTRIEHPSVLRTCEALEKKGVTLKYAPVDAVGRIDIPGLATCLSEQTVLVATSYINSEIGTIQPLHKIKKELQKAEKKFNRDIYLLVDAAQAPFWVSCQVSTTGADLLTLDFAKCGGPKGSGVLVSSRRVSLMPVLYGGGQESGKRPGTENVLAICGGAAALVAAQAEHEKRAAAVARVRDAGIELLTTASERIVLNGSRDDTRVANNINVSIAGVDTEFLTIVLDTKGFAVSTKSACAGAGGGKSEVIQSISGDEMRAISTLRITLGPATTVKDLRKLTAVISEHLQKIEKLTQK